MTHSPKDILLLGFLGIFLAIVMLLLMSGPTMLKNPENMSQAFIEKTKKNNYVDNVQNHDHNIANHEYYNEDLNTKSTNNGAF